MRIAFDAKRAFNNKTGLGNYSRQVIAEIIDQFPEHEYFLYTPKINQDLSTWLKPSLNTKIVLPNGFFWKKMNALWRFFALKRICVNDKINLFHGLSGELPWGIEKTKIKTIVSIHDLIFLRFPEYYSFFDRKIHQFKFKKACQIAHKIIAISQQTQRDIVQFLGIDVKKIQIIYQDASPFFKEKISDEQKEATKVKYKLNEPFILCVSTIEERKNQLTLVKALQKLNRSNIKLILVGKQRKYAQTIQKYIQQNNMQQQVLFLGNVEQKDLLSLYHLSEVFVYPSVFEGFGIPILEALKTNALVITANNSSLTEVGGEAVLYFDAYDSNGLKEQLAKSIDNEALKTGMQEKIKKQLAKFSPIEQAKKMMKLYLNA